MNIEKETSYKSYSEINNIIAYVVNIHDPVNYDLDLLIDDSIKVRYENVTKGTYRYRENWNKEDKERVTYRCRLKGVAVKQSNNGMKRSDEIRRSHVNIVREIDRIGGWIIVTLSDIDIYNRILIDITDPSPGIKDLLLNKYSDIFYPYDNPNFLEY